MDSPRVVTTNRGFARRISKGVSIGRLFAFVDPQRLSDVDRNILDDPLWPSGVSRTKRATIPLRSDAELVLPGLEIHADDLPQLSLACITTDRDLYRHSLDIVNVLVVDLDSTNKSVRLSLRCRGMEFENRTLELNSSGIGIVHFSDLPIGSYELVRKDVVDKGSSCQFNVAAFELAPLVVTLAELRRDDSTLLLKLKVTRFGEPYDGEVSIRVCEGDDQSEFIREVSKSGWVETAFEARGSSQYHLEVSLTEDESSTANVALPGTSRADREETVLSNSGVRYAASLVPIEGSTEVLGLHVHAEDQNVGAIHISGVDSNRVCVTFHSQVEACCCVIRPLDNSTNEKLDNGRVIELGEMEDGSEWSIEPPEGVSILSIGGFVDERPWESVSALLCSDRFENNIEIIANGNAIEVESDDQLPTLEPAQHATIRVRSDSPIDGHAVVTIRDARLQPSQKPKQELARQIKSVVEECSPGRIDCTPALGWSYRNASTPAPTRSIRRLPDLPPPLVQHLVRKGVVTDEQVAAVEESSKDCNKSMFQLLVEFEYAEAADIFRELASYYRFEFVELDDLDIEELVLSCVPESVARENDVIPIKEENDGTLVFAIADPFNLDTIEKLRFILNRNIKIAVADLEAIHFAINDCYGQVEGESADSMLMEFTDLAIDFCSSYDDAVFEPATNLTSLGAIQYDEDGLDKHEVISDRSLFSQSFLGEFVQGCLEFDLVAPSDLATYTIDAFIVANGKWEQVELDFRVSADPRVELYVPEMLMEGDSAFGRVFAACNSGTFSLNVFRDGELVPLFLHESPGRSFDSAKICDGAIELNFSVLPGKYLAEVVDLKSGDVHRAEMTTGLLGLIVEPRRSLRLLSKGESIRKTGRIKSIRLLNSVDPIQEMVASATANYQHLCCEQTAAKLLSSVVALINKALSGRYNVLDLEPIRVGLRRLRSMWHPSRGFLSYPDGTPSPSWGRLAVEHLLKIEFFHELASLPIKLESLLADARQLTEEASLYYRIAWRTAPRSAVEAYANLRVSGPHDRYLDLARATLAGERGKSRVRSIARAERTFAIACLLRSGIEKELSVAIPLANAVLDEVEPNGRLYSTVDSVALLVLLLELSKASWSSSTSLVRINGQTIPRGDESLQPEEIDWVESIQETVPVEIIELHRTDWNELRTNVSLSVNLKFAGKNRSSLRLGDRVDLHIRARQGYQFGDVIWVFLPPCLSKIEGGGQLKQFAVDLEGQADVTIPLAATALSSHPSLRPSAQRFLVCLRNMYDEERIGFPGPQSVLVDV